MKILEHMSMWGSRALEGQLSIQVLNAVELCDIETLEAFYLADCRISNILLVRDIFFQQIKMSVKIVLISIQNKIKLFVASFR